MHTVLSLIRQPRCYTHIQDVGLLTGKEVRPSTIAPNKYAHARRERKTYCFLGLKINWSFSFTRNNSIRYQIFLQI